MFHQEKLEELRKCTPRELVRIWAEEQFPFDKAICGYCITNHCPHPLVRGCYATAHIPLALIAIDADWLKEPFAEYLARNLDQLYAARLFYRDFYASTPAVEEIKPNL